jgi:hypothetical protein
MGSLEQSSKTIRVSALQWTPIKGDVVANWAIVEQMLDNLRDDNPDLVVLPEMAITGYIWRDKANIEPLARHSVRLRRRFTASGWRPHPGITSGWWWGTRLLMLTREVFETGARWCHQTGLSATTTKPACLLKTPIGLWPGHCHHPCGKHPGVVCPR